MTVIQNQSGGCVTQKRTGVQRNKQRERERERERERGRERERERDAKKGERERRREAEEEGRENGGFRLPLQSPQSTMTVGATVVLTGSAWVVGSVVEGMSSFAPNQTMMLMQRDAAPRHIATAMKNATRMLEQQ